MKYAFRFYNDCRDLLRADEIIIKYNGEKSDLLDFVKKYSDEIKITLNLVEYADIKKDISVFKAAKVVHDKIGVIISLKQREVIPKLEDAGIPYYFDEPASSEDDLVALLSYNISDIRIVNELGFKLIEVADLCHSRNIQIRVFPNVAQSSNEYYTDTLRCFFIRPEDVDFYESYVDILEFFGPVEKQSVLSEIYMNRKWLGDLKDIIIGINSDMPNTTLLPYFGDARVNCGKRCTYNRCSMCKELKTFSKMLEEKGLSLTREKQPLAPKKILEPNE